MRIFISIEASRKYNRALIKGITRFSREKAHWSFFYPPQFWEHRPTTGLSSYLKSRSIDAIITLEQCNIQGILDTNLPTVVSPYTQEYFDGKINIVTEHKSFGALGAQHLQECGFRHFAYCGYNEQFWSNQRLEGFAGALAKSNSRPSIYVGPKDKFASQRKHLAAWIEALPKPVGIMACVDERGRDIIEACKLLNIEIPEQVGVIAADDDEMICALSPVPLSSISGDTERAGYAAAQLLHTVLSRPDSTTDTKFIQINPVRPIGRESSDLVHSSNKVISRAVALIRKNATNELSVSEVAESLGISRRKLEKTFRSSLGRTVLSEIKRSKILLFEELLLDTSLSIAEISERIRIQSPQHAARYFKSYMGKTPQQYRKEKKSGSSPSEYPNL